MNLVLDHVLESLVVGGPKEDHDLKLPPVETVVHDLIPTKLVTLLMKCLGDLLHSVL